MKENPSRRKFLQDMVAAIAVTAVGGAETQARMLDMVSPEEAAINDLNERMDADLKTLASIDPRRCPRRDELRKRLETMKLKLNEKFKTYKKAEEIVPLIDASNHEFDAVHAVIEACR